MRVFENHKQWKAVKEVSDRLSEAGYQVLLAGGCVRDYVMKRAQPSDFDIATDAVPDQVHALFPNALTVGKAFGVTIIPFGDFNLEVATFREDLEYKDGRRPEGVRFSSPEADAKRRDFTANALFYDIKTDQVIDYVGGVDDIKNRVLRTVGDPDQRFNEDKLRLLRAVRFAAQLDFELEPATYAAVKKRAAEVAQVSRERVRDELLKLLKTPNRIKGLKLLVETGLLKALFPELAKIVEGNFDTWIENFQRAAKFDDSLLFLALFFWPVFDAASEKEFRETYLRGLRLDNRETEAVMFSLKNLKLFLNPHAHREGEIVLLLSHFAAPTALSLAKVIASENGESERYLESLRKNRLGPHGEKPAPFVTGADAVEAGFKPGPEMGAVLQEAYLQQLEGKLQDRSEALDWLKKQVAKP